jgi:predicted RNA binding protein YcfA (HicA-like mRNA interferase family)
MAKLPTDLSGRELRTALERTGFVFRRQTGSHMILRREEPYARVVIPITSKSGPAPSGASSPTRA